MYKRDIKARIIKIEAFDQNSSAFTWPSLERMSLFPYAYNQQYMQMTSYNLTSLGHGSFSDEQKKNFLNSKISFCSQMLLYDKFSQAMNKAVLHQGE